MSGPRSVESSDSENLEAEEDDTWEDAELDEEELQIVSFFDDKTFPTAKAMVDYCKEQYGFDFLAVQKQLDLDFYGNIKLVNFIRTQAKTGTTKPELSSVDWLQGGKYLQPVLEDDALLFCLDDLLEDGEGSGDNTQTIPIDPSQDKAPENSAAKVQELEHHLARVQSEFAEYRKEVEATLEKRWEENEPITTKSADSKLEAAADKDKDYFDSYSYNGKLQKYLCSGYADISRHSRNHA